MYACVCFLGLLGLLIQAQRFSAHPPYLREHGGVAAWEHHLCPPPHAPSCMCVAGPDVWSSPTGDICGVPFPNSPVGRDYVRAVSIQVEHYSDAVRP